MFEEIHIEGQRYCSVIELEPGDIATFIDDILDLIIYVEKRPGKNYDCVSLVTLRDNQIIKFNNIIGSTAVIRRIVRAERGMSHGRSVCS